MDCGVGPASVEKQRHFIEIRKGFPPTICKLTSVVSYFLVLLSFPVFSCTHVEEQRPYRQPGAYRCKYRDTSQSQITMLGQESEVEVRPFVIPQEDVEVLNASEAFCMLRSYLARDTRYVRKLQVA